MFNVVKKLAFAFAAVMAFSAVGSPAVAEAQTAQARFNDVSNARPTVSVSNYTKNPGCTTCWGSTVTAAVGEVIAVDVAYVNTAWDTNTTAFNSIITLDHSANASGFTIRGGVDASNANPATGSVNVTISTPNATNVTLKPLGADWYVAGVRRTPNANGPASYSLGDVQPGWPYAGDIVVRFQVMGDGGGTCEAPAATTADASNVGENSATLRGSYLGTPTASWFEFGTSQSLGYRIDAVSGSGQASGQATGLLPNKTYYYKFVTQNTCGRTEGVIKSFTTQGAPVCPAPAATTGGTSNVGRTSATLLGTADFAGKTGSYWFAYGTSPGNLNFRSQTFTNSGAANAFISGLSSDTTYYYKLVVQTECGTREGSVNSFHTDRDIVTCPGPSVSTGPSSSVTRNSAVVTGSASGASSVWVEYGTSAASLGGRAEAPGGAATLSGLQAGTTYYYRFAGSNNCGTDRGTTMSFRTQDDVPQCVAPAVTVNSATNIGQTSASVSGTVNPNGSASSYWFAYGTSPGNLSQTTASLGAGSGTSAVSAAATLAGLQPNTTYYYQLVSQNCGGTIRSNILSFTTTDGGGQCVAPGATATNATNVGATSATARGNVDPNGYGTTYWIAYGTSSNNLTQTTNSQSAGSGTSGQDISATLSGLTAGTTYFYQVVAQNCGGTTRSNIIQFTTIQGDSNPEAETLAATNVTQTSATLNGRVRNASSYTFEYGTTQSLGQSTGVQTISSSAAFQNVSAGISGLQPNTTYYFRVVAYGFGTANGQILSFTTPGSTQCDAPAVSVTGATNIGQNSATFNGSVNPMGRQTDYWFEYGTNYSFGQTSSQQSAGSGTSYQNVSVSIAGLSSNTTYYFRLVARNSCGTTTGQTILNMQTGNPQSGRAPDVTTQSATSVTQNSATLNGQVDPNGSDTTAWFEYGLSQYGLNYTTNTANVGSGDYWQNIFQYVSSLQPGTTYYFRAAARNTYGTNYGQVLSFTTPGTVISTQQPTVITDPATGVGRTTALLNGRVNPNGGMTSAWFEYGQTSSLGLVTPQQPMGSGSGLYNYAFPVSGLQPSTTYYFRAVAQNQAGTAYGQILSFRTTGDGGGGGTIIVRQPPVIVTTVGGGGLGVSCLVLTPTINQDLAPGTEFIYGITYRNDCPFDLQNATMRIFMPNEVDFSSTNYPFLSRDMNVVTYNLGTVPRNFQATILVRGLVKPTVRLGDNLIFKSDLSFMDPQGRFQSVSAFLTAVAGQGVVMTASIFDSLLRFLSSGWFWLLLFLLLLAMFVLWLATRRRQDEDLEHGH